MDTSLYYQNTRRNGGLTCLNTGSEAVAVVALVLGMLVHTRGGHISSRWGELLWELFQNGWSLYSMAKSHRTACSFTDDNIADPWVWTYFMLQT